MENGEEHINIITLKKIEFQLSSYLINLAEIDKDKFTIYHYGNVKGSNEFMRDNVLILLGTPEPNIWDFLMQISVLYEGEQPLSNKRFREKKDSKYYGYDYRLKDERYHSHVKMKRENELKQDIDRVRWVLINDDLEIKKKRVYLYSMADIGYSTKKVSREELMADIDPKFRINKKIQEAERNPFYVYLRHLQDGDTKTAIYRKVQNVIPFKKDKRLLYNTYKILIRDKHIVKIKGKHYLTDKGKSVLFSLKINLCSLALSREKWE